MKARVGIVLVALVQIAVVFAMAAQREWILRRSPTLWLRTAPVDPDDAMRGAYSQLSYDLNVVPREQCRDGVQNWFVPDTGVDAYRRRWNYRDTQVYATVETGPDGVTRLTALSDRKPSAGRVLRGRVDSVSADSIRVRYGIEAYFSDKKQAEKLDQDRRDTRRGVPLDVEVAVADSGQAVLKQLQWEPLGLTIHVQREPRSIEQNGVHRTIQVAKAIEVEIKNHGDRPVGVVVRPNGRSFRLVPGTEGRRQNYRWVHEDESSPPASAAEIRQLAAGGSYRETIDLHDAYWTVRRVPEKEGTADAPPIQLNQLTDEFGADFRIEYAPGISPDLLRQSASVRPQPLLSARWWPARSGID